MVLRAIATYNDAPIDIHAVDVQSAEEEGDKKTSELPTPNLALPTGERSPLPRYSTSMDDGEGSTPGSRTHYDSVGIGPPPPPRKQPLRMGSAFYSATPAPSELLNTFDESFAHARRQDEEEQGLVEEEAQIKQEMGQPRRSSDVRGSWWETWIEQLSKLFVPQWRRTVILMWIIWGLMSFCKCRYTSRKLLWNWFCLLHLAYTMFNVWLPAVLENRATGEGDEAIREALTEFVLYSSWSYFIVQFLLADSTVVAGCPGSIVCSTHLHFSV